MFLKYCFVLTDNNSKWISLPWAVATDRIASNSRHFFMVVRFFVLYSGTALDICRLYVNYGYLQSTSTWHSDHVTWVIQERTILVITNCAIAAHKGIIWEFIARIKYAIHFFTIFTLSVFRSTPSHSSRQITLKLSNP
jgi:hypothetical protein